MESQQSPGQAGRGIVFTEATVSALRHALERAYALYAQKKLLNPLRKALMQKHFTWSHSAREYIELFQRKSSELLSD